VQEMRILITNFLQLPISSSVLGPNTYLSILLLNQSIYVLPFNMRDHFPKVYIQFRGSV